jgi:hypothetical protein
MKPLALSMIKIVFLCALLCCFVGCVVNHGHFTVASNKVFRLSQFEMEKASRAKAVEVESVQHIVIFIPIGSQPTIEGAMDEAMKKGNGDVMTDVNIESWFFFIPYIYGQAGWSVKGDVVKTRKN